MIKIKMFPSLANGPTPFTPWGFSFNKNVKLLSILCIQLIINSERTGIDYSFKKNNIFMLQSKINEKNELLLKLFSIWDEK